MADESTSAGELEDSDERPRYDWSEVEFTRLLRPESYGHLAGIAVAVLVLFWPDRTEIVVGRLIGIALVAYGTTALWVSRGVRPRPWLRWAAATASIGLGLAMAIDPTDATTTLGRILGGLLAARGVWGLLSVRRHDRSQWGWRFASGGAFVAVGALLLAAPTGLYATFTVTLAGVWIGVELIALTVLLDPERDLDAPVADTTTLVWSWFEKRPKTVEDRNELYRQVLYEGETSQTRIVRFSLLMVFASVIASMGVVSDSTAVVVGAMLIAPLMTPLMAMALSLVMGWPNRLGRASLVAAIGIAIAIAIGFMIGLAEFTVIDTLTNGQIVSRSNPTIVDLVIAVAAGAAGAYGLSRPDVSNSLPGVAVAIALVPPLTVIGISYAQRDWDSGNGALLLFLTNAIAILIVGALMFLLLGVAPLSRAAENQHRVRTASAVVAGAAALVVGALVLNGTSVATNVFEQRATQRVVAAWVQPFPGHTTVDTAITGDRVTVVLAGPATGRSPSADELADLLSDELGRRIDVDLRVRLERQETSSD